MRTIFRDQVIDTNGRPKPSYFRADPPTRGFSVDRMRITDLESLVVSKKADARYNGYLRFVKAYCRDVRALETNEAKRLFCVYDSATAENNAHADICQNLYLDPGTPNRKHRMMEIAWQLKMTFGLSQPLPPGL